LQLFEHFILFCPYGFIKISGRQENESAGASDKSHRSHKLNTVEIKAEIIRYAKGGRSFSLSWTLRTSAS
jgi:hypothetical protein